MDTSLRASRAVPRGRVEQLLRDTRLTGEVLLSPVAVYRRLRHRRPVLGIWLSMSFSTAILMLSTVSISQRAAVHMLQDLDASSPTVERVAGDLQHMKIATVAVAPASLALRWSAIALGLWALGVLGGKSVSFRTCLSIVAVASGPALLGQCADLVVAWHAGPEFLPDMTPTISSATSIAALFPAGIGGEWGTALLDQITLFAIWTGALWVVGLRQMARLDGRAAWVIALAPWVALRLGGAVLAVVQGSLSAALDMPAS